MATECPIRMIESTDRWSIPKISTRYKSSSGKLLFEEIGLLFRNPEKDIMPSRSESAPPSMEGSMAAMRNIPSFQERSLNHDEICEGLSSLNLENEQLSNTKGSYQFPMGSLPVHAEESQDDSSSVRSGSIIVERATVLGSLSSPFSKKEDSCCSSSPSHDQNNSYSCNSRQGAFAYGSDSHVNNISVDTNNSCSDNMSQISSLDGSKNIAAWPYVTNSESHDLSKEGQSLPQNKMLPHGVSPQQAKPSEVQGTNVHPGITSAFGSFNQLRNAPSGVPMANIQPLLHASRCTPPLYADAAAYMASSSTFYPYMQPAGYVAPMYLGGYNLNPAVYPSGYPHQGVAPFALGGNSFLNSGVLTGANAHAYDLQNLHRYHGQVGAHQNPHPSMHYFQPTLRHPYGYYIHFGHQASSDSTAMNQNNSFNARKPSDLGAYKSPQLADTSYGNASQRRRNPPSHYNSESQKHADSRGQNPAAFVKPVSGNNFSGDRHNMSHNHSSDGSRNKTTEQVWNPSNVYIFLEELKSGKGQSFELPDIAGHIVDFSVDQHGSRFIQQKLETCSIEEKESVLKEILPHASKLITDVFGNYVIQKLFEYGSQYQRKYLTNQLEGEILTLSMQMYGCRVIQKALDVIDLEEKTKLVRELEGHVMKCVYDQNGNHVIQKCIECIPTENIHFVISSFRGHVEELSKHPYGCRVIQRILERCSDGKETQFIVDEILDSVYSLAQDQYGNYVTQQVLVKGKPRERKEIVEKLAGSVVHLSQHKFASNVIEKCIEFSDSSMRELLIQNIVGHGAQTDNLLIMMKDQFANYVVQKILEKCSSEQRNLLLAMIRNHLTTLKKYTYGKHIVARFERLCGEG